MLCKNLFLAMVMTIVIAGNGREADGQEVAGGEASLPSSVTGREVERLRERVRELEQRLERIEKQLSPATAPAPTAKRDDSAGAGATRQQIDHEKAKARSRMRQDNAKHSREEIAEAEKLYQVANKNWRSDEAVSSLKTMVAKYLDLNRTGCALLYLAQMAEGQNREDQLKVAAEKYGDCYYGNGVQVGAFARYLLGHYYQKQGKQAKAEELFAEIRKSYPDAITHSGDSLVAVMNEETNAMKGGTAPATQPA